MLEAGPFWDPDEDWVSDEAGSHQLYWTDKRIIGGEDPVELGKNNSGKGVGGSMVHYAGYCPRFHPSDFEVARVTASAQTGRSPTQTSSRTTSGSSASCRSPAKHWPWGDPHGYPHTAASDRRRRRGGVGRRTQARHRDARRPRRRSPTGASATVPTASTAASACRAARSTRRPRRWSPISPTRSSTAPRSGPTAMVEPDRGRRTTAASRASATSPTGTSASSAPPRWRSPATRSRRRGCC